jgi:predicted component of type VI protein secretion system
MKLTLSVILAYNKPVTNKMECTFDEQGGTIGRGLINNWVLPDEEKYLSRSHASIECVRQTFYLLNTSTNGIFINNDTTSLEVNKRLKLEDGMHLIMGGYKMEVAIVTPIINKPPPVELFPEPPKPPEKPSRDLCDPFCNNQSDLDDFFKNTDPNIAESTEEVQQPSNSDHDLGYNIDGDSENNSDLANKLLRIAIQGTMEVLQSRAEIKQEMRMDVTLIQRIQNNPIKFSETTDEALQRLLAEQPHSFMPPEQALHEAFDDIKAHQIAVITGIQASLVHVLRRFEPKKLMQRLEKENPISAVIPVQRQAKLWAKFEELYDVIVDEVEEDFNRLFRQAFVKAYDEQIEKLSK